MHGSGPLWYIPCGSPIENRPGGFGTMSRFAKIGCSADSAEHQRRSEQVPYTSRQFSYLPVAWYGYVAATCSGLRAQ